MTLMTSFGNLYTNSFFVKVVKGRDLTVSCFLEKIYMPKNNTRLDKQAEVRELGRVAFIKEIINLYWFSMFLDYL